MKYISICVAALMTLSFASCHNHSSEENGQHENAECAGGHDHDHDHDHQPAHDHEEHDHDHDHDHGEAKHESDDHITFTQQQAKSAGLAYEKVKAGTFRNVIKTSGELLSAPGDERVISAKTSGIVSFSNSGLNIGTHVTAGQSLFTVSAKGISDGDQSVTDRAAVDAAKRELDRAESLLAEKLISRMEYERIKSSYETARAALSGVSQRAATAAVGSASPISGYIVSLNVRPGQYVNVGEPLATVSQTRKIQLRAALPERYQHMASSVTDANFVIPYSPTVTINVAKHNGRKVSTGQRAERGRYIPLYFDFDNPGNALSNGLVVETYLLGEPRQGVISVPRIALTEQQGNFYVYIKEGTDTYHKQPVQIGASDGARVEIVSGLQEGVTIVTKGANNVKMAGNVSAIPAHSHSH